MARKSFFFQDSKKSISRSGLILGFRLVCPPNPDLQASTEEPGPLVGADCSAAIRAQAP